MNLQKVYVIKFIFELSVRLELVMSSDINTSYNIKYYKKRNIRNIVINYGFSIEENYVSIFGLAENIVYE